MKILFKSVVGFFALLFVALFAVLLYAWFALGLSPAYLYHAPPIAAGIGAKLACSSRYVSGFDSAQTTADINSYSPLLPLLDYQYLENKKVVRATFASVMSREASFYPGIGCALEFEDENRRTQLKRPELKGNPESAWRVNSNKAIQTLLDDLLHNDNAAGLNTRALLVAKDGHILAESYAAGVTQSTPLLGWSMAKSVNSILLGVLEFEGKVQLNQTNLFKAWQASERASLSLKDLLTMTDGLNFDEVYDPGHDAIEMLFKQPSMSDFVLTKNSRTKPGAYFNYSSGTANLLSRLIQIQFDDNPQKTLDWISHTFKRMGLSTAVFELDSRGTPAGSSWFFASARDWGALGQLMLNKGRLNGRQFLSEAWVEESQKPGPALNDKAYGLQWWLNEGNQDLRWPTLPEDAFMANGNRKQYLMLFPSENILILRLGWTTGAYPMEENFVRILQAL